MILFALNIIKRFKLLIIFLFIINIVASGFYFYHYYNISKAKISFQINRLSPAHTPLLVDEGKSNEGIGLTLKEVQLMCYSGYFMDEIIMKHKDFKETFGEAKLKFKKNYTINTDHFEVITISYSDKDQVKSQNIVKDIYLKIEKIKKAELAHFFNSKIILYEKYLYQLNDSIDLQKKMLSAGARNTFEGKLFNQTMNYHNNEKLSIQKLLHRAKILNSSKDLHFLKLYEDVFVETKDLISVTFFYILYNGLSLMFIIACLIFGTNVLRNF